MTANSNASFQDAGGGRTVLLPAGTTATLLEGFTTIEPILSATGLTFVDLQLIDVSAAGARVESRLRFLPVEVDGRAVIMAQRFAAPTDAERISQAAAWMREVCRRSKHKCRQ